MNKIKCCIKKTFHRTDFSGLSVFGHGQGSDWEVLLALFLVIIAASLFFSIHVFLGVRAGDIFSDNSQAPVHNETINRDALDRVIKNFDEHAENLKNLQAQKPVFVDPSL